MSKILLDTSVIIDFLRSRERSKTLLYALAHEELYISIITHAETYAGKSIWERNTAKKALEEVLLDMIVLPLTTGISENAGYIKAYHNISLFDSIIAATALDYNFQLATLNIKDFEHVPGLQLYNINHQ